MKIHTGIKQAESLFKQTSALGSSIGSSSAIDTSKIIKITTIRKNLDENSSHAEVLGRIRTRMGMFFIDLRYFPLRLKLLGLLQLLIVGSLLFLFFFFFFFFFFLFFSSSSWHYNPHWGLYFTAL